MTLWGARGLIPRMFLGLTFLVIIIQFFFALLSWEGTPIRRNIKSLDRSVVTFERHDDIQPTSVLVAQPQTCDCGIEKVVDINSSLLLGTPRHTRGYMTIGIPTIKRKGGLYLFDTLDSLINCTTEEEKAEIVLVVFLADFDAEPKADTVQQFKIRYTKYISDGFIQVIQAPKSFYPNLDNLKRTYNHPEAKVKWRSKQNYDYAYLFKYSEHLSTYYLQLEDDVETVQNFITAIKHYVNDQTTPWVCLEYSSLGYIGKLYHSGDLDKLAKLLMLFYQEQPPDFLYLYFNVFLTQFQQRMRVPTLFQHMGYHSSLPNKVQPLKDRLFDNTVKLYHGDNPPATLYTTLRIFQPFVPNLAYSLADGFFWAKESKKGDSLLLVFDRPEKIKGIAIDTGSEQHKDDRVYGAILEAGVTLVSKTKDSAECTNYVTLGQFTNGSIRLDDLTTIVHFDIFCVRVRLTQDSNKWLIFREIAVFR